MRALAILITCFCFFVMQSCEVWAQAAPSYNGRVNNAIGGIVQSKAVQEGFAANDNRVGGTMTAIGSGVGAFATTVVGTAAYAFVAGTAVAWLPLLAAAAAVGVGTALVTAGLQWAFGSNGTVTVSGAFAPKAAPQLRPGVGAFICEAGNAGETYGECLASEVSYFNGNTQQVCSNNGTNCIPAYTLICPNGDGPTCYAPCARQGGTSAPFYDVSCSLGTDMQATTSVFSPTCGANQVLVHYQCVALTAGQLAQLGYSANPSSSGTLAQVSQEIPPAAQSQPIDPSLLASLINQQWQAAASQPGYQGLPWQASNPVTSADVSAWQAANPSLYPTVGDALAPIDAGATVGNVGTVKVPDGSVGTAPSTNPGTNPGTGNELNLGPDPGIGSPGLEATPTAQQIISPLTNVFPALKTFALPAHHSACPTGSFSAFGKTFTVDAHCTIFSNNAAAIQAGFLVFWTVVAVLIILAA